MAPKASLDTATPLAPRLQDFLTLSFVFIYIPGSFVEKQLAAVSLQRLGAPFGMAQTPRRGVCDVPKGQATAKWYNLTDLRLRRIADA
jgi:hypothetical protein